MNFKEKGNIGEEFVNEIFINSFMEPWCYPNPKDEKGDKKEICDLLILFNENLIIISVKNYEFKELYTRYFRQTIEKASKQIYGAERKLLKNEKDIFIKHPKIGFQRFPKEKIKNIYRVIINLGGGVRFYPFNQETIDNKFITILDKEAFQTIAKELDTIPDFLEYLTKRESFFTNKIVTILPGDEEDFPTETVQQFLEYSEKQFKQDGKQNVEILGTEHDLLASFLLNGRTFPEYIESKECDAITVNLDGSWDSFNQRAEVKAKKNSDKNSYFLDELVKREILKNYNENTLELASAIMSFNRFYRRRISDNFIQFFNKYKNNSDKFFSRNFTATDFNNIEILFAFYTQDMPKEIIKTLLKLAIDSFCVYSNYKSKSIILIATTNMLNQFYFSLEKDISPFTKEREKQIKKDVELLGWFKNQRVYNTSDKEYPDVE